MYSQIILLLFGLHTISAQLKNIPPPPSIPRLDVASLPNHLQKLLTHVNDVQSNLEVQGPQIISRAHTYGMSLRSGQGEVWNDITGNYTNGIASSEPISPNNREDSRNSSNYYQTAKTEETAAPQTSSGQNIPIGNYKDDQSLSSITPSQTLSLEKPENGDQRGNNNPNKNIPSDTTVQSQNIPVPTNLEDQKFKKTPSAKTYGMNLAGGHGHVWNNIGGSHLDVNDATPSESVHPESKDKHYPAAAKNENNFVSPATLQPVEYPTTPEASSEKPVIVNYKESNHDQNLPTFTTINPATTAKSQNPVPTNEENYKIENEIKKVTSPKTYGMNLSGGYRRVWNNIGDSQFDVNSTTPSKYIQPELTAKTTTGAATVKPIVYTITPEGTSEKPAIVDNKDATLSQSIQSELMDKTAPAATDVDKFTLTSTVKPMYNIEAKSEDPAIVNYKENNQNQNLPTVTTIKPATAITSQNPVPTNIKDYKVENGAKTYPSPKTYGMNLSGGHGRVWNNIGDSQFDINNNTPSKYIIHELKDETTPAATNYEKFTWTTPVKPVVYSITPEGKSDKPAIVDNKDAKPAQTVQSEIKDTTTPDATGVDKFTLTSTVKPMYNIEATSEDPAIVNYKESNHNQNLPTFTTIKPATAVTGQNPVPTNIKDYKDENGFKKYPSPKTYGMNLSGGHGHVWNNIDESYVDINKTTPSKSVQSDFKDKTTSAATNGDNFTWTTPVKPVVYTSTLETTSEKPEIVNYKDATPSESAQLESKDKTSPVATNNYDLTVKPIVYTMSPEASPEKPAILPSITTTNTVITVKSQKPVSQKEADQKFENGIKKTPSSKTYGMNLSGGHGYVWNNIERSLEHFDDNSTTPSKLIEPEDETIPAPTNTVANFKDSNKFYQESPSVTSVNLAIHPYTTSETLTENTTRISYPYRSYNENIPSVSTPQTLTEKAPTYVKTQKDNEHQNQEPLPKPYSNKINTSNKDILKRASPRTYGMRLEGDHGYVWNDLIEPGMHYNLDEEINDSKNPTPANDENFSEVPVTKKPTENATSANVDPISKNDTETLPESTALPSTDSYRITSTERNKNNDSSSDGSSELEPEDDLLKYIEKLVKDEVAKLLESIKEKNPDKVPVTTEKSDNGNETMNIEAPNTENPTEDPNTSNVSASTEKVNETTVSVTTERWTEPTSTEAFNKPSTKTPKVNDTTEADDTEQNTNSNKVPPESNEELQKYIEKLVREEVAKRLENATKTDNTNDAAIKQDDKKPLKDNANNTLDNIPKNVTNFYGSLIGEGNVTNIFIFYPNDKSLESIVNDAKNIIKPQKNKSNETEADDNKTIPTEAPSTLTTELSTTTNTERPATESTNTPATTSTEKDNPTISVTTENSSDSTTSEPKFDSSTDSETTTKGSLSTTTEANNKKDETPELKEEIKKYIDKLVKDEVADQLDKERKNRIEKEKEPEVIPVTTEKSNDNTTDTMSTEYPATDKNTEAPDSTNATTTNEMNNEKTPTTENTNDTMSTESPTSEKSTEASDSTTSTEQVRETTSESTEKPNNDNNNMMSTEPPTTHEASTQSNEKVTTDNPNINSTTEANTNNEDGSPSEPKMPVSAEELKKYVEKLVKDEVAKLLDADKNNGSKKENETDIIPVTTEKANNDLTDAISTESPVTENNTGAPDSTNSTTSSEDDRETNPDPTEKSNNDTNDAMSTESPTTEVTSTQSSEKTTTESPNVNSSTEANTKNEDGSPSEPKMPVTADELKKYVEKLVKDEVAKLLDAEKNNGSKKENEPDVVPVTTEKSDNETTDGMSTESPATEKGTEAPDSTDATTSSENGNDTTDTTTTKSPATEENTKAPDSTNTTTSSENGNDATVTTEKSNDDTTDTMSTEPPATEENTEAPDSSNATASSEKDTDTTPVTTEGSTEANKEETSTESSNATSTTEADKQNDETTSSNMTPKSKEEIKKYVEQLVKEEVAKQMAAGKNEVSKNEDAKPANA